MNGGSIAAVTRPAGAEQWQQPLRLPSMAVSEVFRKARCQRTFASAHTYHINSISVNSDQVCLVTNPINCTSPLRAVIGRNTGSDEAQLVSL